MNYSLFSQLKFYKENDAVQSYVFITNVFSFFLH